MQKILVIDDEPHMLKLMERIITEKTAYQIICTSNPLEAPQILEGEQFDLLITDLRMPGMDGMDILRYIQENNRWEKVIIMTAFGSLDTALEALAHGVYDYITKPFKKEQIIFTINRAMRWQSIKRETMQMSAVFDRYPYEEALGEFRQEYIRQLAIRFGEDVTAMAERSGLSAEEISSILKSIRSDSRPGP